MASSLYLLSLKVISNNIQGDISKKIEHAYSLNLDTFSKKNIIKELETSHIRKFIDSSIEFKGILFEYYISRKQIETIKIILKYYPQLVDIPNCKYSKKTPLYKASGDFSNYELVELLLKYGADPNILNGKGKNTALMISSSYNDVKIANLLLQYGANYDLQNSFKETALHIACWPGNLNMVKLLLKHGANCDLQNKYKETPLKIAIKNGFTKIAEILTEYGGYEDDEDDKNK